MIILRTNTTWSGKIELQDDYQVAPGVQLTIAAGSEVTGNNHQVRSFGTVSVSGTASAPIHLDDVKLDLSSDNNRPGNLNVSYAFVDGGHIAGFIGANYGDLNVQNSVFIRTDSTLTVSNYNHNATIDNNIFLDCRGVYTTRTNDTTKQISLSNNVFDRYPADNDQDYPDFGAYALQVNGASFSRGGPVLSTHNSYLGTGFVSLSSIQNGQIISQNDYFGAVNQSILNDMTYDSRDDLSNDYIIDTSSAISAPYSGAPSEVFAFSSLILPRAVVSDGRLLGTDNIDLTGNALANELTGNAGNNLLDGGRGVDTLAGGKGNDRYVVDNAGDQVLEAASGGIDDCVYARLSYTLTVGQEVEVLATISTASTKAIDLTGNDKSQSVYGNAGANVLDGKAGYDVLYGLGGADSFAFSTVPGGSNVDRIADFSVPDDTIRLSRSVFSALGAGTLNPDAFKDLSAAGATIDANDRILYDRDSGRLYYDADGSGGGAAVQFAILNNKAALTFQDFLVV